MSDLVVKLCVNRFIHSFEVHFSHFSKHDVLNDVGACSWSVRHLLVSILRHIILRNSHTRIWNLRILSRGQGGKLGLGGNGVCSLGHLQLLAHHIEVVLIGRGIAVVVGLLVIFTAKNIGVVFISLCYLIKAF
jgi:hypothetical protein